MLVVFGHVCTISQVAGVIILSRLIEVLCKTRLVCIEVLNMAF